MIGLWEKFIYNESYIYGQDINNDRDSLQPDTKGQKGQLKEKTFIYKEQLT